ncbi:MAG TPA: hypothetical protein VLE70_11255 [Anaerolineae bacterium]|nr:hypothetical protein [Anaerolineae bacterium]
MYCQRCGAKLTATAGECVVCGQPVNRSGWRVAIAMLALMFMLLAAVIFLVERQPTGTAVASVVVPGEPEEPLAKQEAGAQEFSNQEIAGPKPAERLSIANMAEQVNPAEGFLLPAVLGDVGPKLLESGAIDYARFVQTYDRAGRPLTEEQLAILTEGSDEPLVIDRENAYFLLNLLWAFGLTKRNVLLTEGPMMQYSEGDVGRFASTGGWTLGQRPATELYSSAAMVTLTTEQQERLEAVAYGVYRPCCDNHTAFADCNHGMAMLGLLELMAAQGATEDEMFAAAKHVNAFWFPQQAMESAVFFKAVMNLEYADVDGRMAAGPEVFSGSGFRAVHQWLADNGKLEQAPNTGSGCGV